MTTPHSTTGCPPAQLLVGRQLQGRLDLLHPKLEQTVEKANKLKSHILMDGQKKEFLIWGKLCGC